MNAGLPDLQLPRDLRKAHATFNGKKGRSDLTAELLLSSLIAVELGAWETARAVRDRPGSRCRMIELVKAIEAKALDSQRVWLRFSDGREGIRDMSDILATGGAMVEPLRDPTMFARVFIQFGVPTWPNGFDLDAIALHGEMARASLLSPSQAA